MSYHLRIPELAPKFAWLNVLLLVLVLGDKPALATGVIEEITFESGSVGPNGMPATSGWQFNLFNNSARIDDANIAAGFNRTFTNGTNTEALLMRPFDDVLVTPGPDPTNNRDAQGAFWVDTSGTPETIEADEVVYSVWEHYAEFSRSNQRWKTQLFLGKGSGNNDGLFDDVTPNAVSRVTWTWGDNGNHHANVNSTIWNSNATDCESGGFAISCGTLGGEFSGTRYGTAASPPGPGNATTPGIGPTPADLEMTHISAQVYRTVTEDGTPTGIPIGTELELNDTRGGFNGGDSGTRSSTPGWNPEWGGNPAIMVGNEIDQLSVSMWRHIGFNNLSGDNGNVTPSWINIGQGDPNQPNSPVNGSIGIKYLRVGTANYLDVNVDDSVDVFDRTVAARNHGLSPTNNTTNNVTGATFFHGDVDNDLDVDDDDLAKYRAFALAGDFNGDGVVDAADFTSWRDNLGSTDEQGIAFNGDGLNGVDSGDYDLWVANFGRSLPGAGSLPEPSSVILWLTGLVCLAGRSRRKCASLARDGRIYAVPPMRRTNIDRRPTR